MVHLAFKIVGFTVYKKTKINAVDKAFTASSTSGSNLNLIRIYG